MVDIEKAVNYEGNHFEYPNAELHLLYKHYNNGTFLNIMLLTIPDTLSLDLTCPYLLLMLIMTVAVH